MAGPPYLLDGYVIDCAQRLMGLLAVGWNVADDGQPAAGDVEAVMDGWVLPREADGAGMVNVTPLIGAALLLLQTAVQGFAEATGRTETEILQWLAAWSAVAATAPAD